MSFEVVFVLALLAAACLLLASEAVPVEGVGLLLIAALAAGGVLTPAEAFGGFANPAVLMIAGIMLLTGSLVHNGVTARLTATLQRLAGGGPRRSSMLLVLVVNAISAFINNVAATALFIPVAERLAHRSGGRARRLLIPVAFASMTGGLITLIGTSANIAVAGGMEAFGLRPLGFFELAPIGLLVAGAGSLYLGWVLPGLLDPPRAGARPASGDLAEAAEAIREYLFEVRLDPGSPLAGGTLAAADLGRAHGLTVLAIDRGDRRIEEPGPGTRLEVGDVLLVKSRARRPEELPGARAFGIAAMTGDVRHALLTGRAHLAEATVSYDSPLIGRTLREADFRRRFGASVLAIHRRDRMVAERVGRIPLEAGDALLVHGPEDRLEALAGEARLLVEDFLPPPRGRGAVLSILLFGAAVGVAAVGWVDAPVAFLAGGALALLTGCLPPRSAARHLNLRFLVLLAALVALASAVERSGAGRLLAGWLVGGIGEDPLAGLAVVFGLTVAFTQVLSNAAAALVVLPLALDSAAMLGADPRPFAVTVAVAASCSFLTPLEPACLLVHATGHYRFGDFVRAGLPLALLVAAATLTLVPLWWPL